MAMNDIIHLVVDVLLSGGVLVSLVTLRSTLVKSKSEARKSKSEADQAGVETEEKASKLIMQYIVEPLKTEINGLRKDVRRLNRAIDKVKDCKFNDNCPVRRELQDIQTAGDNDK